MLLLRLRTQNQKGEQARGGKCIVKFMQFHVLDKLEVALEEGKDSAIDFLLRVLVASIANFSGHKAREIQLGLQKLEEGPSDLNPERRKQLRRVIILYRARADRGTYRTPKKKVTTTSGEAARKVAKGLLRLDRLFK